MALALSLTAAAPRLGHTPPCTCPRGFGPATPSSSPPRQAYQHRSPSSALGPGHPQEFRVTWDAGCPQPGRWCVSPRARLALLCRVTTHRRLHVRIWFTCDDLLVLGLGPAALEGPLSQQPLSTSRPGSLVAVQRSSSYAFSHHHLGPPPGDPASWVEPPGPDGRT